MPDVAQLLASKSTAGATRPRHTFNVPDAARVVEGDPATVTFETYPISAELDAMRAATAAGGGGQAYQYELIRRAVVLVDGKPPADPEWLDRTSPNVRTLLTLALDAVAMSAKADMELFLNSRQTKV